jgi:uncharacterized protein
MTLIERRYATLTDVEVREQDGGLRFSGHAAVFNSPTNIGPFREQVAPGAFKRTLGMGADVRLLFNHEPDSVMARTTNGTLRLSEDGTGLLAEADLDPSDWDVQRLLPKLRSGNVSQMSFGFRVVDDAWSDPDGNGRQLRTLNEVQLFDVSAVTFPAYDDTDAALNSIARGALAVAESRGIVCDQDVAEVASHIRDALAPQDSPAEEEREEQTPDEAPPPAEEPRHVSSRSHLTKRLAYIESTL